MVCFKTIVRVRDNIVSDLKHNFSAGEGGVGEGKGSRDTALPVGWKWLQI